MSFKAVIIAGIIAVGGCSNILFAEAVRLVGGKIINGRVLEITDSIIRLEINGVEEIVRRDRVDSIALGDSPEAKDVTPLFQTPKPADLNSPRAYALGFEVAQDADPRLDLVGGSLYIQHVWKSGLGIQANLGRYIGVEKEGRRTKRSVAYSLPLIVNIHLSRESIISPFAGIGVVFNEYKVNNIKTGVSPLADIGFVLGGDSPMRVVCNLKYFINLYSSKANMLTGGIGVSINW